MEYIEVHVFQNMDYIKTMFAIKSVTFFSMPQKQIAVELGIKI